MNRHAIRSFIIAAAASIIVALLAAILGSLTAPSLAALILLSLVLSGVLAWMLTSPQLPELLPPSPAVELRPTSKPHPDLFEAVLGSMIDGVAVVDASLTLLYVNRAARALLDLGDRPVTGRLITEVSRSAPLQDVIQTTLRARSHQRTELQLIRQRLTVAISAAPLELDSAPGVLIVLHDVTDLRRLERMRSEFVSNVSHELKTPLTSIQAYADTLISGGLEDADHNRSFVERILEQAERLQTLIQDLLRLARIESDEVNLEIAPVNVTEVIDDCLRLRRDLAAAKGLKLTVAPPPQSLWIAAEAEGLRTIISNLVDNAINYTPSGGRVSVAWQSDESQVRIAVADTGVGIPKEHQSRVFERFYRVDRARSRAMGGTGLGLSIVKHLVQAFGGRIELESEQGKGSRFTVWLPRADSPDRENDSLSSPNA
jgi:two-component system, OmpR family, phosphate regulon sensor histidine kinase PhoR